MVLNQRLRRAPAAPDPFEDSKSLCRRSRYARLRAGTAAWWPRQFHAAQSTLQKLQVSQLWLTWASENTIIQSLPQFESVMAELEDGDWTRSYDSVEHGIALTLTQSGDRLLELNLKSLPDSISPRSCVALALRTPPSTQLTLYRKYLADYTSDDQRILQFCQNGAVLLLGTGDGTLGAFAASDRALFQKGRGVKAFCISAIHDPS